MAKKYIFLAITLVCIAFFYKGIPIDIFNSYSTLLTLIGGTSSTVLLAATIFHFYLPKARLKANNKPDNLGCFFMIIVVVFFFGFSGFLIFSKSYESEAEIEKNGVYTVGEILGGSSFKTRRSDLTSVVVRYKTKEGKVYQTDEKISAKEFDDYTKFQQIPIVYSAKYPSIIKILRNESDIAKYSKVAIREITVSDLQKIIEMKTPGEMNQYLNSVNQKWDFTNTSSAFVFTNDFKKISINVTPGKELVYVFDPVDFDLFEKELETFGFKKINTDKIKGVVYMKPGYILNIQNQMVRSTPRRNSVGIDQKTIIYFLKTNKLL